ncbi:unnamed protein product [Protopolystoma xenopodis]|uniref:Uncharacterized protein n=1 Tax=Protopolystoma xenopodis TaxID=117903 RepID=A0A448WK88_9PLAT|nr:unnamed protein product [Protopolystoma xenopodis]
MLYDQAVQSGAMPVPAWFLASPGVVAPPGLLYGSPNSTSNVAPNAFLSPSHQLPKVGASSAVPQGVLPRLASNKLPPPPPPPPPPPSLSGTIATPHILPSR